MSHCVNVYKGTDNKMPMSTASRLWAVNDDGDDYIVNPGGHANGSRHDLADCIIEKLTRAEALAVVLQGSEHNPEMAGKIAAMVIAELVKEALEAYEKQWVLICSNNESAVRESNFR